MARATPTPLPTGFRRRFPLELTPEEYAGLDEQGRAHGSKRAAILAGLGALKDLERLRAALGRVEAERDEARGSGAHLTTEVARLEEAVAKHAAAAKAQSTRGRTSSEKAEASIAEAVREVEALEQALATEREARDEDLEEIAALRAMVVEELRCPRCGDFADSSEWAAAATPQGVLVYHGPCGYHRGGLLEQTSVLGRRAAG